MTMTTYKVGDIVRRKGSSVEIELEDINPNTNYAADDEYFASGWSVYGTEDISQPDEIELVMSGKEAVARKLPTADEIVRSLDITGSGWGDVIDIGETEPDGPGSLLAYGKASNGLRVAFRLTVSEVERGDI